MTREQYHRTRLRLGAALLLPAVLAACLGACGPAVVVAAQAQDGRATAHGFDAYAGVSVTANAAAPDAAPAPAPGSLRGESAARPAALLPDGLVWESRESREKRRRDWRNGRHDRYETQVIRRAAPLWRRFDGALLLLGLLAACALWGVRGANRRALHTHVTHPAASQQIVSLACDRCSRVLDLSRGRASRGVYCPRCGAAMPRHV